MTSRFMRRFGRATAARLLMVAAAVLFLSCSAAQAIVIFAEDWEDETVGDHLDELNRWQLADPGPLDGSIVNVGGNKMLELDPPNSGSDTGAWVNTQSVFTPFNLGFGNVLSLQSDLTLFDDGGSDATANMMFHLTRPDTLRYGIRVYPSGILVFRLDTGGGLSLNFIPFSPGFGTAHTYEVQSALFPDRLDMQVFVDGAFVGGGTDSSAGRLTPADQNDPMFFRLNSGAGRRAHYDNFRASVIPEPSIIVLLGIGLAGLVVACRKRKKE